MRVLYWAQCLPLVFEKFVNLCQNRGHDGVFRLQVEPYASTASYSAVASDEIVRASSSSADALRSQILSDGDSETVVILDGWGIICSSMFDEFLRKLSICFRGSVRFIVLLPRSCEGICLADSFFNDLLPKEKDLFAELFLRRKKIFEMFLNYANSCIILESSPTSELLFQVTGKPDLAPYQWLGVGLYPKGLASASLGLSNAEYLAQKLMEVVFGAKNSQWIFTLDSMYLWERKKDLFGSQIHAKDRGGYFAKLTPSCSWSVYCEEGLFPIPWEGFSIAAKEKGCDSENVSLSLLAKWLVFQAILDAKRPLLTDTSNFKMKSLFDGGLE